MQGEKIMEFKCTKIISISETIAGSPQDVINSITSSQPTPANIQAVNIYIERIPDEILPMSSNNILNTIDI
jgi:hypothetical protein